MVSETRFTLPTSADLGRGIVAIGDSPHSSFPNPSASQKILAETAYLLGVRPWHLGQLLGTSSENQIYRWTSGRERPCSLYLSRLLQLVILHVVHGWSFIDIRRIDWESREVFPRKEKGGSNKTVLPVGEWTFPNQMGEGGP